MNYMKEAEEMSNIVDKKKPKAPEIKEYLRKHFKEECNYNATENTIYLCNNDIIAEEAFIDMLKKWKVFVQPSMF